MQKIGPTQDHHAVLVPLATHWGPATCEDVDCIHFLNGWKTIVPVESEMAEYIRNLKNHWVSPAEGIRHQYQCTEERQPGGLSEFIFPPGQPCFRASRHIFPNGRPEIYVRRMGEMERHTMRQVDWMDSLHATVDKAVELVKEAQNG